MLSYFNTIRASGGIGIRARLKIVSRKGCGFDAHLAHKELLEKIVAHFPATCYIHRISPPIA